jgi:Aspartyl protease
MSTRRDTCVQTAACIATVVSAAFVTPVWAQGQGSQNDGDLTVPFDFAADRGSLLVHARVDNRPARLILDTGSSHTILRPSAVGMSASELAAPRTGGGVIGDAVGREVTLEIGQRTWRRRKVAVMDLSQVLSSYKERIDGLLGIDLLLEFSEVAIHLKRRALIFTR